MSGGARVGAIVALRWIVLGIVILQADGRRRMTGVVPADAKQGKRIIFEFDDPVDTIANADDLIVTPHNFDYMHNNENACSTGAPIKLLVLIHSSTTNFVRREGFRASMVSATTRPDVIDRGFAYAFMLGKPLVFSDKLRQQLGYESSIYGDIVQEDFIDAYNNLTLKNQMWMKWATTFCPQAEFILKTDDDMFIDFYRMLDYIDDLTLHHSEVLKSLPLWCARYESRTMPVLRSGKWGVKKSMFSANEYPMYCSGASYILTMPTAQKMYNASLRTPFFWVDDVWTTGMVSARAGVRLLPCGSWFIFGGGLSRVERMVEYHKVQNAQLFGHFPERADFSVTLAKWAIHRSSHALPSEEYRWWRNRPDTCLS